MRFSETDIHGVWTVELEPAADERGFFARAWCAQEMRRLGLADTLAQCSISHNHRAGTLRGLHYQAPPHAEAKLVRVIRGAAFDVAVDVRPDSPTFAHWRSFELTEDNGRAVHLAPGIAHGFQALTDHTELLYMISMPYAPDAARGVRYDDPMLAIDWPLPITLISDRDRNWPLLNQQKTGRQSDLPLARTTPAR